jgi:hypothetical protein
MQKKLVVLVAILLVCATLGAFAGEKKSAQIPWLVAHTPGTTELGIAGGYTSFGIGATADLSIFFGDFDIGPIPVAYGVTALGEVGFGYGALGIGAGAFFTLELGADWGGLAKFENKWGIGPGLTIALGSYYPIGFGIGTFDTGTWWFSDSLGLYFEGTYVYSLFGYNLWSSGIGVEFKI